MQLERDRYGEVSYDPVAGVLELRWFESTAEMTDADFRRALERLASHAEERRAANVLIDVTFFRHRPAPDFGAWRDANIISPLQRSGHREVRLPRPTGGRAGEPSLEPPGTFPTGYFESREAIADWFTTERRN